jgi:hypothetical protein
VRVTEAVQADVAHARRIDQSPQHAVEVVVVKCNVGLICNLRILRRKLLPSQLN